MSSGSYPISLHWTTATISQHSSAQILSHHVKTRCAWISTASGISPRIIFTSAVRAEDGSKEHQRRTWHPQHSHGTHLTKSWAKGTRRSQRPNFWSRLTKWKFPLVQLIATLPRPPLGRVVEVLTVVHLTLDPLGSIEDFLYKLEGCQHRVTHWRLQIQETGDSAGGAIPKDESKVRAMQLAIIAESYSKLSRDVSREAKKALQSGLDLQNEDRKHFLNQCATSAGALAADRATTFVPVIVAELVFIAVFWIDIVRLQSTREQRLSRTTFDNIEVHSIGFSALFFWLIPSVMIGAIIGTSQPERAIPRILTRFERDVRRGGISIAVPAPTEDDLYLHRRWRYGMYSWQRSAPVWFGRLTKAWEYRREERALSGTGFWKRTVLFCWPVVYMMFPFLILASAIVTGVLISVFVPPVGFRCRTFGETYFAVGWTGSYLLSNGSISFIYRIQPYSHDRAFRLLYVLKPRCTNQLY